MQALSRDGGGGQVNDLAAGVSRAVAGPVHGLAWSHLAQHLDGPPCEVVSMASEAKAATVLAMAWLGTG
jgi:hypothetical protein